MRDYVLYLLARLALLVVVLSLGIMIFGRNLIAIVASILISALLSYVLLAGMRDRATGALIEWRAQRKAARGVQAGRPRPGSDEDVEDRQVDGN